jgi:aldehyde dehydrogenase (NAD+)
VKRLKIGEPLDGENFTGPVIHRGALEKVESYNELARKEGANVLLEGGRLTDPGHAGGCYLSPFVYRMEARPGVRCVREEVFGPHVALVPFRNNDDAIKIYNDTPYGLSMAVITEDYGPCVFFGTNASTGWPM